MMADADDVRRLALSLPAVTEVHSDGFDFRVADKGFVWSYPERRPGKARIIRTDVAVLFVGDEAEKQALLLGEPELFFTAPGYDGWPLVMLRLGEVDVRRLQELVTDAWRMRAPEVALAQPEGFMDSALGTAETPMTSSEEKMMTETDGTQDVVDILTTDHREATALIAQIRSTRNPDERRDLADTLISELVRHSVAEEMYVYPAMKKHLPDGDAAVEHDTEEHKELETTMKELEGVDAGESRFDELVGQLEATLRDHISDEEADQFPQLRARVPRDELIEMAQKVETAKKMAPTRPHPSAPNSAVFHKLVGPGVGLVDRLRDKLTGRSGS